MKTPRVAVTGTTGRVGAALARALAPDHTVIELPRRDFDLSDPETMAAALERLDCDLFLNPAGLTSLEDCLDRPGLAWRVNAEAPGEIAAWASRRGIRMIHFSTDYVFGELPPGLRNEDDPTHPPGDYGRSKLAGENAVLAHPGHCVVRISWVFGPEKPSFVDQVRRRALAGEPLAAVADKFSLPTGTRDLTEWIRALADAGASGVFHACNSGNPVSWHDLATATVRHLHQRGKLSAIPEIEPQLLAENTAFRATRVRHTAMATTRLAGLLGCPPRPWQEALAEYLDRS